MLIEAGRSLACLVDPTDDEKEWVRDFLTFETFTWVRGKRRGHSKSFLSFRGQFPVGLVPMVARHGQKQFAVSIQDTRGPTPPVNPSFDGGWLRDYQQEIIAKCLDKTRGIVASPTGSGKGEMIVALTWAVEAPWVVLVHRDNLVDDLGNRFEKRTGEAAGWVRAGTFEPNRVTFGTFQSFYRRLCHKDPAIQEQTRMLLEGAQGIIADEAHTIAAETFKFVTENCKNTFYRFGFSGTPFDRTDAKSIAVIAAIGPRIAKIDTPFLIERGYIPRPIIRMVPCVQKGTDHSKFATVYKHTLEMSRVRNRACIGIMAAMDKPAICFVKKRDHGISLATSAAREGHNVVFVDGKSSKAQREEAIKATKRGAVDVLISTVVFQEGLNIPELRSVANFAGGRSVIEILQRLGRGMRKDSEDDHTFQVWDIFDVVSREPGSKRQKWLQKHSRIRAEAMSREGHEVLIGDIDDDQPVQFDPAARITWDVGSL